LFIFSKYLSEKNKNIIFFGRKVEMGISIFKLKIFTDYNHQKYHWLKLKIQKKDLFI